MKLRDLIKKLGNFIPGDAFKQQVLQCYYQRHGGILRIIHQEEKIVVAKGTLKKMLEEGLIKMQKAAKIANDATYYELEMEERQLLFHGKIMIKMRMVYVRKFVPERVYCYGRQHSEVVQEYMKEVFMGRFDEFIRGPTTIAIRENNKVVCTIDGISLSKKEPMEVKIKFAPHS